MRRRRRSTFSVFLLCLGILLATGAAGTMWLLRTRPDIVLPPGVPAEVADLRTLLLPAPEGSTEIPNLIGGEDGTVSLVQAAAFYDSEETGKRALQSLGFRDGAAAGYRLTDGNPVFIVLLRFDSAARAEAFAADNGRGKPGAHPIPSIPAANYVTAQLGDQTYHAATIAKNDIAVSVSVPTAVAAPEVVVKIAQDQYARLP